MIQGHLRRFPRFDVLSDGEIRVLERAMVCRRYREGQTLIREGDRAGGSSAAMYLVLEGTLDLRRTATSGVQEHLRTLGPGQLIGVIALIRDTRRTATAQIATKALIASIDRIALDRLAADNPGAWAHLQHTIALQLAADFRALHERLARVIDTQTPVPPPRR